MATFRFSGPNRANTGTADSATPEGFLPRPSEQPNARASAAWRLSQPASPGDAPASLPSWFWAPD